MALPNSRIEGNVYFNGSLSAQAITLPAGAVGDSQIQGGAKIAASKLQHQHERTVWLTDNATSATPKRVVAHVVRGATATILEFKAGVTVAATSTGVANIDLKKNGTTILTATVTLDATVLAFTTVQPGGYTSLALVAGDVLEVEIVSISGSAVPKGVFVQVNLREDAD